MSRFTQQHYSSEGHCERGIAVCAQAGNRHSKPCASILAAQYELKHRVMLGLIDASSFRRREMHTQKMGDMLSEWLVWKISCSRARQEGFVPISDKGIAMLHEYYAANLLEELLIEGQAPGSAHSMMTSGFMARGEPLVAGIKPGCSPAKPTEISSIV